MKTQEVLNGPELDAQAAMLAAEAVERDVAGKLAAAVPFPGPTRDVFAVPDWIPVGKWRVRPFFDMDFEVLQSLNHPLYDQLTKEMAGQEAAQFVPRGPDAWVLFWMFTHEPEELDALVKVGQDALRVAAKNTFGRCSFGALLQLYQAVVRQIAVFSGTAVAFGAPSDNTGEEAKADSNPPRSGRPSTGTAG